MTGRSLPSAAARIGRLGEIINAVTTLLAGEVTTFDGRYITLADALLLAPRPVQAPLPRLVGGNGFELLRIAGKTADIVSLTGLGRTLEDGHRHQADWSTTSIDQRVGAVRTAAPERSTNIVLDALVQHIEITDRRDEAAEQFARTAPGLTTADVLGSPYAHIGTLDEIVAGIHNNRSRWGFTSYVVRADAIDAAAAILRHL
jgi:alkanesulfonate monooxygenase SsuD/methylene tetrahydromethanopterin reductase-like flavin-dependent oxidoreductase (luciferase family)